jgi:hypothetical protein
MKRRPILLFALRFSLVFALLLVPLPYVAGGYTIAVGHVTNAILSAVDWPLPLRARYRPPEGMTADASWKMPLLMEDREQHRSAVAPVDVRSFSYRPMAAFVALAAASTRRGLRRNAILWGGGLCLMVALTTLFTALPVFARFATWGSLGGAGIGAVTAYRALATPVMAYVLAALAWWAITRLADITPAAGPRPSVGRKEGDSAGVFRRHGKDGMGGIV